VRANVVFPPTELVREGVTLAADRELRGY
jgi:hypothetical protein